MLKILKLHQFGLFIFLFAGCSTVNLLPEDFIPDPTISEQGKVILLSSMQKRDPQNRWAQFKIMKVVATDLWQSQSVRYFTPIPDASQQIQFAFNLNDEDAAGKLLNGKQMGNIFGIADGKTYFVTKGVRTKKASAKVKGYLPPVRNYFLWPQIMHNYKNIAYLEQVRLGYGTYYKVFVSNADWDAGLQDDQYIVWVNRQTLNIEYIEFTLRDLAKSYHGVVQYRDYREVDGVALAHTIILLDHIDKKSSSHKFYVEIYNLQ